MLFRGLPLAFGLLAAAPALACGFHNYAPPPSLVDRLQTSDRIILARTAPDDPFRYAARTALLGPVEGFESDQLVDSVTRRKLAGDPVAQVLFARDAINGSWQKLAFVDPQMGQLVDTVMDRLDDWHGPAGAPDRFAFFADQLGSTDPAIHKIALRELDQADYGVLRSLVIDIPPAQLMRSLDILQEVNLKPIRLLLLGLVGDGAARDRLEAGTRQSADISGRLLGAYATALIELDGPSAVRLITREIMGDPSLTDASREMLAEALALHSLSGDPDTRAAILSELDAALAWDPTLAPSLVRQFSMRRDWTLAPALDRLTRTGETGALSAADRLAVAAYLSGSSTAPASAGN
ncbi:hypothetical protein [Oceanomicrobium pacificus]|uniref:HEAT repeat domain-containing protein n=1 Tax=Oceanomicrobium pacificus TaxID=2692916 RepID=A0A6B0TN34_9RHOB|nr:hypothetical protein [Oceanomicrobium pacificus]MXU66010.1 hypothetical protein [Oceanomicrobium pacificus]